MRITSRMIDRIVFGDGMSEREINSEIRKYRKSDKFKHEVKRDSCRVKVSLAIKNGTISRKSCVICGDPKSQAHHPNYNSPLKVIWLCAKHHRRIHSIKYKTETKRLIRLSKKK